MANGLKVGTDIITNTDEELAYSSEWNNWKVFDENTKSLTISGSEFGGIYNQTTVTHDLGYVPLCEVWFEYNGFVYPISGPDKNVIILADHYIDTTKLYVGAFNYDTVDHTISIKYKIYHDRLDT